ncbi:hypothetical protein [Xanthomonas arboricola]|uniref:hypothetical protein n=1 Tax=Xanthomonas arboricola TaxID=56448 RepID=UPI0011AF20FF|nr:hypothetical protein [Xanthomonas arboricola]MDN0225833.1 hypothetical protein [Xanthomonas arboricola pv. juglandis]MDN0230019.1 hypothetical protein [Xanthomonas arboricola pv. juglandis]MDN0234315.1 hypothetical protein [Xanthomonas arboricola pv. juglandis]MDN0238612.1 hypothetical protein [Xanthomonas arboricola pv. juglandis]MDN0242120.1 hypothetical protein [Xanthomonas arboricola pv. juglandis]
MSSLSAKNRMWFFRIRHHPPLNGCIGGFLIKVLQFVEKTQPYAPVVEHRYVDIYKADGLLTASFRAKFGRKRIRRSSFIYDQMLEDLNPNDRALWTKKRCFIEVSGFSSFFVVSGEVFVGQWHTLIGRPRFCPVIVSDRMVNGVITCEFSLLTALSKLDPFVRPLCIDGDPRGWLTMSSAEALAHLFKWQVGGPDLIFPA